jgi:opacity protein-like surface antigen
MPQSPSRGFGRQSPARLLPAVALSLVAVPQGAAADPLGLYVGGAIGEARVEAGTSSFTIGASQPFRDFSQNHSAFKLIAGIRPLSIIGAEVSYLDFGHPTGHALASPGFGTADVSMKGATATGLLFLPIPLVEAYAKAGLARMQATVHATYCGIDNCAFGPPQTFGFSRTNTSYVAGVGAQFKAGSFGLRAEYERFNVAGSTPGLASIGATWTF